MARMIPPYYSEKIESTGEKRVFELLKNDPETSDWVCLHSLALARHIKRSYGEIDFVVMVPGEGIFCLEIKSGNISRNTGIWNYRNRYGETITDTRGPFRQAEEGMFSLIDMVRKKFGKYHHLSMLLYGYAVIFPHIIFNKMDPEYEPWQIYDRESSRQPISAFIRRLSKHTHDKMKNEKWYNQDTSRPRSDDISQLIDFLRGDFELFIRPADKLTIAEEQLLRLTEEQYRCLDGIQDNRRCLIQGGSGTGKTLLALEFAKREERAGRKVLLVCFNRFLGQWIASQVIGSSSFSSITADYYHHFLDQIISKSIRNSEFRFLQNTMEKTKFFMEAYPKFAIDAINEGVIKEYDIVVVDEGQDLICPENLDVLDSLLTGGLAGGRWMILCDFYHQAIYSKLSAAEMIDELDRRSPSYCRFRLTVNCRNTRQIGEETSLLSGLQTPPFLMANVEGYPVEYRFFTDTQNQKEIVSQILRNLIDEGIPSEWITILSPKTRQHSCIASPFTGSPCLVEDLNEENLLKRKKGSVVFSTIHAFKGLESPIIIIIDIEHLSDEINKYLIYTGMSRARQRLFVLMAESVRNEYLAAVKKRLEKGEISRENPNY